MSGDSFLKKQTTLVTEIDDDISDKDKKHWYHDLAMVLKKEGGLTNEQEQALLEDLKKPHLQFYIKVKKAEDTVR